jgi:hypothetical protein
MVRADQRDAILDRVAREPWASIHARLEEQSLRPAVDTSPPWSGGTHGANAETAEAAAFLAWLHEDADAAARALALFPTFTSDWDSNQDWDINIRMAQPLIGYSNAVDLLRGAGLAGEAELAEMEEKLLLVTRQFFEAYVETDATRRLTLGVSQNNHPLRSASAIGYVALLLRERPETEAWLDFAGSEISYLYGPDGRYVQPDGGVSEEPFYFGFGYGPAAAFILAARSALGDERTLQRDCRNRNEADPWLVGPEDCVDGERFAMADPMADGTLSRAMDWTIALRLPSGYRAPVGDGYWNLLNGSALLAAEPGEGRGHYLWDGLGRADEPLPSTWGLDMLPWHLSHARDDVVAQEPPWSTRFFPDTGQAAFRSGWDEDARFALFTCESGAARKTLHDHVDGLALQLDAYGESLLVDPGYYKPNELDNALTADAGSHNVHLVDGAGAPDKGLLNDWGDADCAIRDSDFDGELPWVWGTQSYGGVIVERVVVFVADRFLAVADHASWDSTSPEIPHDHSMRWHLNADFDAGGTWFPGEGSIHMQRDHAGLDAYFSSDLGIPEIREPEYVPLHAPHVHEFDRQRSVGDHAVADVTMPQAGDVTMTAVLVPYRVSAPEGSEDAPWPVSRQGSLLIVTDPAGGDWELFTREADATDEWPWFAVISPDGDWVEFPDG